MTARLRAAAGRAECLLEARDVVMSFGQTPALRGASVSMCRGEIVAVISLGVAAATLPLLNRITGPETARNE